MHVVLTGTLKPLTSDIALDEAVSLIKSKGKSDSLCLAVDPFVYCQPNHAAFKAAAAGGPHVDSFGHPDPRTFQHIVDCLTQPLAGHAPAAKQRAPVCLVRTFLELINV